MRNLFSKVKSFLKSSFFIFKDKLFAAAKENSLSVSLIVILCLIAPFSQIALEIVLLSAIFGLIFYLISSVSTIAQSFESHRCTPVEGTSMSSSVEPMQFTKTNADGGE